MNAFQILGIEQKENINYNVQLPGDEIDNENDPLIVQLPPIKDFQLSMVKIPIKPTTMPPLSCWKRLEKHAKGRRGRAL